MLMFNNQNRNSRNIMKKALTPILNRAFAVGALPLFLFAGSASAAIVTYTGFDPGVAAGGARPNSDAARAAFVGAITPTGTITFEGLALGNFGALGVAPGVTATLAGQDVGVAGIRNSPDTVLGYNTTAGGSQFLRMSPLFNDGPTSVTFSFATPISAFGAYLTGTEVNFPGAISVLFNDGSNQILNVTKNANGGVQFFGFTDDALLISSVQFLEGPAAGTRDIWGIDDVTFAAVPEPSTYVAGALLLLPFGAQVIRRLRSSKQA